MVFADKLLSDKVFAEALPGQFAGLCGGNP
jgi:hypothetical protein